MQSVRVCLFSQMMPSFDQHLESDYGTRVIMTRGLYTFYQLYEVHLPLALCMVSILERFLIKTGL